MVSLVCKPKLHSLVGWMACVDSELPLCIALDTQILGPLCQYVFLHCDVKSLGVCVCVQVSIVQWHKNHLVLHSTEKIFIYSTEHLANMENVYDITIESLIQLVRAKTELELLPHFICRILMFVFNFEKFVCSYRIQPFLFV